MSAGALFPAVTGDYSLDDFLDAGESEDPDDADEGEDLAAGPDEEPEADVDSEPSADAESDAESSEDGVAPESTDDPISPESVAPAEPTYDWSPDGAECAGCGETAATRWRQDGEYVCADCKEW